MLKILLAFDGSEASLRAAGKIAAMARWWKVDEMCVLNVQPEPSALGEPFAFDAQQRAQALARAAGEQVLTAALALFKDTSHSATSAVELGDAATVIAAQAESRNSTFIALGSHGAGALIGFPIGSVTTKVLRLARRSVLVVPALQATDSSAYGPPQRPVRILLPVDGSPGSLAAVRQAISLVPCFVAAPEIHLLAVYDRTPLSVEIGAMASAKALSDYERGRFDAALEPARQVLAGTKLALTEHTAIGAPAQHIQEAIAAARCDIVCIATRGQSTLRSLVLGSTTAKLLHVSTVPVLVVPPSA